MASPINALGWHRTAENASRQRSLIAFFYKTNAAARRSATQRELSERAQWSRYERCWYRWRLHWERTAIIRSSNRCHCVSAALLWRVLGTYMECIFESNLTAFIRSCHGGHCAPKALLPRPLEFACYWGAKKDNVRYSNNFFVMTDIFCHDW